MINMCYLFNEDAFIEFRNRHPQLRFWQAMKEFLEVDRIEVVHREDESMEREDTYYWHDDE